VQIWKAQSCAGVSGKSQILFALVWTTRYLDLFTEFISVYNTATKVFFKWTSFAILVLVYYKFRHTFDREQDTFRIECLIGPCLLLALAVNQQFSFLEVMWTFNVYLEAVAILPQMSMLLKMNSPETIVRDYCFALAAYRTVYIFDWIYQFYFENYFDPIVAVAGCLQATLTWSFLCTIYCDTSSQKREQVVEYEYNNGCCTGLYIQNLTEKLADIVYAASDTTIHALNQLQVEISRRGMIVKNDELKKGGYKNFKMFVEDQPWLVLFNEKDSWFVRLRLNYETRPPRPLVDANRRLNDKQEKPQLIVEEEEAFTDPYEI